MPACHPAASFPCPLVLRAVLLLMLVPGGLLLPQSAEAMRCGTRLISTGDTQAKVLRYCGDPVQTTRALAYRVGVYPDRRSVLTLSADPELRAGKALKHERSYLYGHSEVVVERWIYNRGPRRLMREVTFENGMVVDVSTLGYGYHED